MRSIAVIAFAGLAAVACRAIAGLDTTYPETAPKDAGAESQGPPIAEGGTRADGGDATVSPCNAYDKVVRGAQPIAYYRFEDGLADEVGSGQALALEAGTASFGGPLAARGRFLELERPPSLSAHSESLLAIEHSALTLEFWFDLSASGGCLPSLESGLWRLQGNQNEQPRQITYLLFGVDGGQPSLQTAEPKGGWHHWAVRFRCAAGSTPCVMEGFIDGTPAADPVTLDEGPPVGSYILRIGLRPGDVQCATHANRIDELALYPIALDNDTIAQHAAAGNCQ